MTGARLRPLRTRRGLVVALVTGLLAVSGAGCLAFALTHQQHPAEPPLATPDPPAAVTSATASPRPTPAVSKPATPVVGPVLAPSVPVALTIPAIGVRTVLQRVGQASDGSLEVPAPGPHYDEPGWYRFSPTPGALGPSVIVGHVDSAANGPSVFWRLASLRPRDLVRIKRADGSLAVFAVDEVRRFRKTQFPARLVYGNTDHAALRLITCGGPLEAGHYRDNVVVLASLIRPAA
jgi:hypothetical protein